MFKFHPARIAILGAVLMGAGCSADRSADKAAAESKTAASPEKDAAYKAFQAEIVAITAEEKKEEDRIFAAANERVDTVLALMPFPDQEKSVEEYLWSASPAIARVAAAHEARREAARLRFREKWGDPPPRDDAAKEQGIKDFKAEMAALDRDADTRGAPHRRTVITLPPDSFDPKHAFALATYKANTRRAELELQRITIELVIRREAAQRRFTNLWGEPPPERPK